MAIEPLAIGVCSWSLQVKSVPELKRLLDRLGIDVVQIACGDPHHAAWDEGDRLPEAARAAGFRMTGAMLGFPGEDYTTPQTIQKTGGFGNPATRPERLERFAWALDRTRALGLTDLMLHAGFLPEPGDPDRKPFLDTLGKVSDLAAGQGRHRRLRDRPGDGRPAAADARRAEVPQPEGELRPGQHAALRQGRPAAGGGDPRPGHPQRPRQGRQPAEGARHLGRGGAAGPGAGQHPSSSCRRCKKVGYRGPLCIEREVGDQEGAPPRHRPRGAGAAGVPRQVVPWMVRGEEASSFVRSSPCSRHPRI